MQNCMTIHFSKTFCSHVNFLVAWEFLILRPFLPSVTQSLFFKEIADICLNTHLFRQMGFWIQKSKLKNNTKVGFHFQATTEWHFQCCLPNEPTVLCWLCQDLQDSSRVCCGSGQGAPAAWGQKEMGRWRRPPRLIAGSRGGNEKEMWDAPGDCSEKCGFSFFQPVLLQVNLFLPCPSPKVCVCQQAGLHPPAASQRVTHHCVPTVSLSQGNTTEKERWWPDISEHFCFPELLPWLLVGICTSGWCKIPHSLRFFGTHSLVDFNP